MKYGIGLIGPVDPILLKNLALNKLVDLSYVRELIYDQVPSKSVRFYFFLLTIVQITCTTIRCNSQPIYQQTDNMLVQYILCRYGGGFEI